MYKIYADEILIYDDTSSDSFYKVASPHLTLEKGAPGSLKMTIPPGTAGYDVIVRMATNIRVEKDGQELWAGRAIQESKDFLNQRQITCEGELAYFNDTTQLPQTYDYTGQSAFLEFLEAILALHNAHTTDDRRIFIKDPDPQSPTYNHVISIIRQDVPSGGLHITTGYENTLTYLSKMVDEFGGYFRIRKVKGIRYLDYVDDSTANTTTQIIEFGKNLMDFTKSYDSTDFATVVIPLGAKQESGEGEEAENYLTVKDQSPRDSWHSSPANEIYVANIGDGTPEHPDLVSMYGWIEKVVHWDEETDASQLMKRAEAYLDSFQFETMVLEVSALDLHYLNPEIQDIGIGELVYVRSAPHGLNKLFPVNKLDIPLDQPQNTIFQLGAEEKVSLTATNKKDNTQLMQAIDEALDKDEILEAAKAQASALMNQNLNGYVTIMTMPNDPEYPDDGSHSEAIYISDTIPLEKNPEGSIHPYNVQRFWKWGLSGLGYTDDWGENFKTAITMDGSILGERIAAGSIHGSKISAGTLSLVTSTGDTGMTIGVETGGPTSYVFERGDLSVENGHEDDTDEKRQKMARLAYKVYLKHGTVVSITGDAYHFEVFKYSNNNDDESGYIAPPTGFLTRYEIGPSNYYRFVIERQDSQALSENDLTMIGTAFSLGNSTQAVIRAEDLRIIGMVTFEALGAGEGSQGSDPRTTINGAYIQTGTVTAGKINAYGLEIKSTRRGQTDVNEYTSFKIGDDGQVTIDGNVNLSESSVISFSGGTTKTIGQVANEDIAKAIADGTYDGGTFINRETILTNEFIAQAKIIETDAGSAHRTGRFVLKDNGGTGGTSYERLVIRYTDQTMTDGSPGVYFDTNEKNSFHFNRAIITTRGVDISKSTEQGAPDPISHIGGSVFFSSESVLNMSEGIVILGHYYTYFDSYQNLLNEIERPQPGQIAFVLA